MIKQLEKQGRPAHLQGNELARKIELSTERVIKAKREGRAKSGNWLDNHSECKKDEGV